MSKKNGGVNVVGPLIIVGLILFCAFQHSFLDGLKILGEIVNIFGTLFVWVIGFIWDIPIIGQKIIKNCVTTIIIVVFFGTSLSKSENKILTWIIGGAVSLFCAVLSWIGMF